MTTPPTDTGAHEMNTESKSNLLWLWLLLGALLLGLLIWAIIAASTDEDPDAATVAVTPTVTATSTSTDTVTASPTVPAPTATGMVMVGSSDLLAEGATATALVGQAVRADSVNVLEVVADEAFYVGPEAGRSVLVRLENFAGAGESESPVKVEDGNTVSFTGTVRAIDQDFLSDLRLYNPATRLEVGQVYVQAENFSITSPSSTNS